MVVCRLTIEGEYLKRKIEKIFEISIIKNYHPNFLFS